MNEHQRVENLGTTFCEDCRTDDGSEHALYYDAAHVADMVGELTDAVNILEFATAYLLNRLQAAEDRTALVQSALADRVERIAALETALETLALRLPDDTGEYEGEDCYTDWLLRKYRYPEKRWRQCSIGYHDECSLSAMELENAADIGSDVCQCPCHHQDEIIAAALAKP